MSISTVAPESIVLKSTWFGARHGSSWILPIASWRPYVQGTCARGLNDKENALFKPASLSCTVLRWETVTLPTWRWTDDLGQ
jgi:hypothetical protein